MLSKALPRGILGEIWAGQQVADLENSRRILVELQVPSRIGRPPRKCTPVLIIAVDASGLNPRDSCSTFNILHRSLG